MSQPEWEVFRSLGDRGIVLVDKTGAYGPEAEIWETYECERGCEREDHKHAEAAAKAAADEMWDESRNRTLVFRFEIERFTFYRDDLGEGLVREMLIPFGFDKRTDLPYPIGSYKVWFYDDLASVASSAGTTREELVEALCSEDVMARLGALECIAGHYGYENFDGYPLDLSSAEMDEREDRQPPLHPDYR